MNQVAMARIPPRDARTRIRHIAFVCRNFLTRDLGGIEVYTHRMARLFARRGFTVSVVAAQKARPDEPGARAVNGFEVKTLGIPEHPFPGFWRLDGLYPLDDRRFAVAAAREAVRIRPDVVEATDYFREGYGLSRLKRRPAFVFRIHGWLFNRFHEGSQVKQLTLKERFQHAMIQSCLKRADRITVVSRYSLDVARSVWRVPVEKVSVIYNGVDTELFKPGETRPDASIKRVVFVGRFLPHKGIRVLEEAMRRILNRRTDVKWIVIGSEAPETTGGSWIRPLIEEFAGRIEWHTQLSQTQLIPLLQKAWVSVVPSLYEPFGLTALEAMACGCPVIASRTGGLKEFVEHERTGLLVEPGEGEVLAHALERILEKEDERHGWADEAHRRVEAHFSLNIVGRRTLELYEQAVAARHASVRKGEDR